MKMIYEHFNSLYFSYVPTSTRISVKANFTIFLLVPFLEIVFFFSHYYGSNFVLKIYPDEFQDTSQIFTEIWLHYMI